jgi:hypothetical protein
LDDLKNEDIILGKNLENYDQLNKIMIKLHNFSLTSGKAISKYIEKGKVVTGHHLQILSKTVSSYHLVGEQLNNYISIYKPISYSQNSFIDFNNMEQTKTNLFWLAAKVDFFEKLLSAYQIYYKDNPSLRRMLKHIYKINRDNQKMGQRIKTLFRINLKIKHQKQLKSLIKIYLTYQDYIKELSNDDPQLKKIVNLLNGNPYLNTLHESKNIKVKFYKDIDDLRQLGTDIVNSISRTFGNIAGSIRWRKGYLNKNHNIAQEIKLKLKPLDILLEKTPFALTDLFIPGFYGHVAIYLGTKKQLISNGMWDHHLIIPLRHKIEAGFNIIESLRPGVSLNTIEGFFNIDHISIFRVKSIENDYFNSIYQKYTTALSQFHKEYDFNFDVTTLDKIVCSELIYHTFGDIKWPTRLRLGRHTIEPDYLVEVNYYDNSPIKFIHHIESFSEENIKRPSEQFLGSRLNFVLNEERSTATQNSYDKKVTTCKQVKKKVRYSFGSRRINRRRFKVMNICKTKLEHIIYTPPEFI